MFEFRVPFDWYDPGIDLPPPWGFDALWVTSYYRWQHDATLMMGESYTTREGSFWDLFERIIGSIDDLYQVTGLTPIYGYDYQTMMGQLPRIVQHWKYSIGGLNGMLFAMYAQMTARDYSWDQWVSDLVSPETGF